MLIEPGEFGRQGCNPKSIRIYWTGFFSAQIANQKKIVQISIRYRPVLADTQPEPDLDEIGLSVETFMTHGARMTDQVRILLIDDDQEDFLIVSDMLAEAENTRFKLDWAQTYEAGLEAICRGEHDVYLLDYFMGSHNGLDLLKKAVEGAARRLLFF